MTRYTVRRDNARDLVFDGDILATARGSRYAARWLELGLYRTAAGQYVCTRSERTSRPCEQDRNAAAVCDTLADVQVFFGSGYLSKRLYAAAGIEHVERLD